MSVPGSITAWRALWRSAPAQLRRETAAVAAFAPAMLATFAAAWTMLPR